MSDIETSLQAALATANARIAELEKERDLWRGLAESREERLDTGNDLLAAAYARADAADASLAALNDAYADAREEFKFQWERADAAEQQVVDTRGLLKKVAWSQASLRGDYQVVVMHRSVLRDIRALARLESIQETAEK